VISLPLERLPSTEDITHRFLGRLPAFPPIAVRMLSALAQEDVAFKEVARLIGLDPALTGEVLRLANSGLYGRQFEVCSIRHAIAMLGLGTISQITTTAALWRGLRRRGSPFMKDWWRHSIAAALIARHSSKDLGPDFAYTAALLHASGQLALIEDAPEDYPKLIESAYADGRDLLACERDVFGVDHALLAGLILQSWGLPEELSDAAAKHHDAITSVPLVLAVQIGCAAAGYAGFGRCGCDQGLSGCGPPAELLAGDYLLETLVAEVNQIECFLA